MTVIALVSHDNVVTKEMMTQMMLFGNVRVLTEYDVYVGLPVSFSKCFNIYVYDKECASFNTFHEIDYVYHEKHLYTTFVLGRALVEQMYQRDCLDQMWFYGGSHLAQSIFRIPFSHRIHTITGLPEWNGWRMYTSNHLPEMNLELQGWLRMRHPEDSYLSLLERVVRHGERRQTRNAETLSLFGEAVEFDLASGFPLLTTKKMFYKGVVKELLWFIKGDTNVRLLQEDGVHIWDGNTSRDFLDSIGLQHYPEGCAGPIYGYQWRHFNAPYDHETQSTRAPAAAPECDQFMQCVNDLLHDPTSRRMIICGWNPEQLSQMCLPPCHVLYQFYVDKDDRISCQLYQRSADLFLGLPFNIASTAVLTHIMASLTGKTVGKIRICLGDAHIYLSHLDNVTAQLKRRPYPFPQLTIRRNPELTAEQQAVSWTSDDFKLTNYTSHAKLESKMVA